MLEEEKNYPKGTIKLEEPERVRILNRLIDMKEYLIKEISRFPVSTHLRSIKIKNKKLEIEQRLEEVDYALRIFEKKRVFLKK